MAALAALEMAAVVGTMAVAMASVAAVEAAAAAAMVTHLAGLRAMPRTGEAAQARRDAIAHPSCTRRTLRRPTLSTDGNAGLCTKRARRSPSAAAYPRCHRERDTGHRAC
eukprot:2387993-Prymnesium_polylepis.1